MSLGFSVWKSAVRFNEPLVKANSRMEISACFLGFIDSANDYGLVTTEGTVNHICARFEKNVLMNYAFEQIKCFVVD